MKLNISICALLSLILPIIESSFITNIPRTHRQPIISIRRDESLQPRRYVASSEIIEKESQPIAPTALPATNELPKVRLSMTDIRDRFARLDNMIGILERISDVISKPAIILDALRIFALAISSALVTTVRSSYNQEEV